MLSGDWDWLWTVLKSETFWASLLTAAIGSLAGAWGGAAAAQRIADKVKTRDKLLGELRSCNIGIELAHGICSTFVNLKKQHVSQLVEDYEAQRAQVHAHHEGLRTGAIAQGTVLDIGALNMHTLGEVPVSVVDLRAVTTQLPSVPARPRSLVAVLGQSIETLNQLIRERNGQVRTYRTSDAPLNHKRALLFGLLHNGWVDETFSGTLRWIGRYTDDCIFFGKLLCADLADHGDVIRSTLKARFRVEAPRVGRVEWDGVEPGLLPPETNYATWITGFPKRVPKTHGRRWRKHWYAMRRWARLLKRLLFRPGALIFIAIAIALALLGLGGKELLRAISARLTS